MKVKWQCCTAISVSRTNLISTAVKYTECLCCYTFNEQIHYWYYTYAILQPKRWVVSMPVSWCTGNQLQFMVFQFPTMQPVMFGRTGRSAMQFNLYSQLHCNTHHNDNSNNNKLACTVPLLSQKNLKGAYIWSHPATYYLFEMKPSYKYKAKSKRLCIAPYRKPIAELRSITCQMRSQCHPPPDTSKRNPS